MLKLYKTKYILNLNYIIIKKIKLDLYNYNYIVSKLFKNVSILFNSVCILLISVS
jgi:hypothetical protein